MTILFVIVLGLIIAFAISIGMVFLGSYLAKYVFRLNEGVRMRIKEHQRKKMLKRERLRWLEQYGE